MKRENFFISEDCTTKRVSAVKFVAPGDIPGFDCSIHFGKEGNDVTMQNCIIKDNLIVKCSPEDAYDFEIGALIALMKMCGKDKVTKACDELYKDDKYKNAIQETTENNEKLIKENNYLKYVISCRESAISSLENTRDLLINKNNELIEENRKLKLDCEKLQHGYNDMMFCGGRQNGKQYTALVNMFKKIDQKKVDAAYKEAYNTTLPVWQKEVLNQMYGIYVDKWLYKIPTKRQEMWEKIFESSKCPPVEIKVSKQDITTFLRELQDKLPEAMWNGSDCPPVELSVPDWFNHDYIYFALFRNDDKGNLRLCYDNKPHSWINKPVIEYIPPMRWDLFKKGRIVIGVRNNYELGEFRKEVKINTGIKDIPMCPTNLCLFYSFDKDNYKIILQSVEKPNIAKINGHKVYYWEDVR